MEIGKNKIEGKVLGLKSVENKFAPRPFPGSRWGWNVQTETLKMLVEVDDAKVWVTVPISIMTEVDRGDRVEFEATIVATKDPKFFIGQRPRNAKVIKAVKMTLLEEYLESEKRKVTE